MPILPGKPHQARAMAESFGSDAARYDRARPRYPDALIERITAGRQGLDVLDVGCGTGIAARQLQAAGATVLGVDVDKRMAAFARAHGLEVEVDPFEEWEPAGRTFDAVVAAQAWHWVEPVAGAVKAASVLRPGGRLAAFWNAQQPPADLAHAFADVYARHAPDSFGARLRTARPGAAIYSGLSTPAADGIRRAGRFSEPEEWTFPWERRYTTDAWLAFLATSGEAAGFSPDTLARITDGVRAAIDAAGGAFTAQFTTVAVTALLS